jgi:hypothetical protein
VDTDFLLVKALMLVNRRIRIRRNKILIRRKIIKGEMNQSLFIMLGVLMMLENLRTHVVIPNYLTGFVRVTTFLDISLVFPSY